MPYRLQTDSLQRHDRRCRATERLSNLCRRRKLPDGKRLESLGPKFRLGSFPIALSRWVQDDDFASIANRPLAQLLYEHLDALLLAAIDMRPTQVTSNGRAFLLPDSPPMIIHAMPSRFSSPRSSKRGSALTNRIAAGVD